MKFPGNGKSVFLLPLLAFGAMLSVAGCEESVNPILGTDHEFSLYGFLNPTADTQWVRVFPIEDRLRPSAAEPLGAEFISDRLETGERVTWRDSVFTFSDGKHGNVFWATFRAEYDQTYRLTVQRTEDKVTSVTVNVPPLIETSVDDPITVPRIVLPVTLRGDVQLRDLEVVYRVRYSCDDADTEYITVDYRDKVQKQEDGWRLLIEMQRDLQDEVKDALRMRQWDPSFPVMFLSMSVRTLILSDDWEPPGGEFDAEVLSQPGVMSNVENGFGFVGAGYLDALAVNPSRTTIEGAGFVVTIAGLCTPMPG